MGHWTRKLTRLLLTPPIYFCTAAVGWSALSLPVRVDRGSGLLPAIAGFAGALGLIGFGMRFIRLYVFGHELTHWLAAKVSRRRTGRFRVGMRSGSVEVENPTVLIVLAPYFTPVYTLILIGIYGLVRLLLDPVPGWGIALFSAGLGATYAFHLALTGLSLWAGQQDLRLYGPVFSVGVILLGNLLLIFFALVVAGKHWDTAFQALGQHTIDLWGLIATACIWVNDRVRFWLGR